MIYEKKCAPSIDSAITSISGTSDHVKVALLLLQDELRDELWMVTEVSVHDDDEVAGGVLDPVHICRPQPQFLCSRSQHCESVFDQM